MTDPALEFIRSIGNTMCEALGIPPEAVEFRQETDSERVRRTMLMDAGQALHESNLSGIEKTHALAMLIGATHGIHPSEFADPIRGHAASDEESDRLMRLVGRLEG